jgi:tryptophan-specific transport protein
MKLNNTKLADSPSRPLWHGITLVAGGAVGAGMFALPLVSAGGWFYWAIIGLATVCFFTYLSAVLLIEVNIRFPLGSSFDTLTRSILGDDWARINNFSIAFIMFILMYAYITAGAGILANSVDQFFTQKGVLQRSFLSLLFAAVAGLFIWFGTTTVSRISTLLMVAMCVAFVTANLGLLGSLDVTVLLDRNIGSLDYLWSALPVFVTAFACAGLVPSLASHYNNQRGKISASVLLGLLLVMLIYVVWVTATLGNIPRAGFVDVSANGGGLSALVSILQTDSSRKLINASLHWFSHFAVITSFLSVGLGLVHFLADRFKLGANNAGRAQTVGLAFCPPLIASVVAPYGFVTSIAYAGMFVAFSFFIVPALMYRKLALAETVISQTRWIMVLIFGLLVVALKLLTIVSWLPNYR